MLTLAVITLASNVETPPFGSVSVDEVVLPFGCTIERQFERESRILVQQLCDLNADKLDLRHGEFDATL